jgi:hypothetical protein
MEIENNPLRLLHPFSCIVSGVSQSGKTELVKKLLCQDTNIIEPCPKRIIVSYTERQPAYDEMAEHNNTIEFRQGLDFDMSEFDSNNPTVIVIDDQMNDVLRNEKIQTLFTRGIHHKSVSIILLTQNFYPQGKFGRDIRLNCHYFIVMRSPTFVSQIQYLGRQVFPHHSKFLLDAYKKATANPYSYLFINLHPLCNDKTRVLQGIFSGEHKYVYFPK